MKILLIGGCGYAGSVLTGRLLERGDDVTVVDAEWFGNFLKPHTRLKTVKMDVRETGRLPLEGMDAVINLANVANDVCVLLDPLLSWEVNVLAVMQLAEHCVRLGVPRMLHASSGSVYGLSDAERVTEDTELKPISVYNETKMVAERVLLSYAGDFNLQIIRPGTICGLSPRMRFDLVVNMFTLQALQNGIITVFDERQVRPAIHVDDMAEVYLFMLDHPEHQGTFNAAFQNVTLGEIAQAVTKHVPSEVKKSKADDPRSYRMCSDKLLGLGFKPRKGIDDAVRAIVEASRAGTLKDEDHCYNIRWMKQHPPHSAQRS
ncbi:MAG: NAD-dependent epimerase/dehydratase [Candidatus Peregrinibacteria bacterium Greene0416_19]|nr:MAG: NAD-dependent epimerase/dehydratase [Candidatus Peregrinibacteria bacterium Greene0416_19]